ncbi:MAG: hybrid sensor histidine kinase/response regulator [Gammaproteobacteria bacterium]|nr:hybrid sensor histidine kinase/response regulator [Gammaproteobacteria bacterium]
MANKNDDFLKKLLATFKLEAEEHFSAMSSLLVALEDSPGADERQSLVETLFREAHSLKGAARAVNLLPIESVCQSLEDVLAGLKNRNIGLSADLFDVLHQVVDSLGAMLASATAGQTNFDDSRIANLKTLLKRAQKDAVAPQVQRPGKKKPTRKKAEVPPPAAGTANAVPAVVPLKKKPTEKAETVRVATAKLDTLLLQTEELLSLKHAVGQRTADLRALGGALKIWTKECAKAYRDARGVQRALEKNGGRNGKPDGMEKKRTGMNQLVEALERGDLLGKSFDNRVSLLMKAVEQDHRMLGGMVDNLLGDMKKILMLPFASLLEIFPKLVRDLSRDRRKEAELLVQGAEIEIDKRILEEMKDPLIHLVRNSIDHGIEDPAQRQRKGKSSRGQLSIAIAQKNGGKIDILVSDDGAGIDAAKVRSAAVKHGVITQEDAEKLTEPDTLSLIFRSGVSTSPIITDISGRGLGLAIVREKVERLGGAISVESRSDGGTSFRIALPLTLATFRGLLVQAGERVFVVPAASVERVVRVRGDDIKTVENRETIQLHGRTLALVRLADVLELPRRAAKQGGASGAAAVILGLGAERIAFMVDAVQGEQEILVKGLGAQLARVRNIAGATVLGTGRVVPILNISDLMRSAVKIAAAPVAVAAAETPAQRKTILVAEDSITARTLVKNILEAAGYDVRTAVDGAEAFALLKTEKFDLVVSDVEMPRMDGFDLTAKIRADKNLPELPVVLVTALESREHRERGIDAGANAYIVKSSFDQSNLLEVVKRLI